MNCAKTLIILSLVSVGLASCRTTEANYRTAYQTTKSAQSVDDEDGLDENTRRLLAANRKDRQSQLIVGNDTIKVTTLFATLEQGPDSMTSMPQYAVVANAFSQVFNAKALCKRLKEAGFTGAYIFRTATPDYYVAAGGCDDIAGIPAISEALAKAGNPGSRAGFPAVVKVAGNSRIRKKN